MPDTPWHIGYAKKEKGDPRRHKGRCIFLNKTTKKCANTNCITFSLKCPGSAHCLSYAETKEDWTKVWKKTRSIEQEKRDKLLESVDRADQYRRNKIKERIEKAQQDPCRFKGRSVKGINYCLLCQEKLVTIGSGKECPYCGAVYASELVDGGFIL